MTFKKVQESKEIGKEIETLEFAQMHQNHLISDKCVCNLKRNTVGHAPLPASSTRRALLCVVVYFDAKMISNMCFMILIFLKN